jgi:hypothetical protein
LTPKIRDVGGSFSTPKMVHVRAGISSAGYGEIGGAVNLSALEQLNKHLLMQERALVAPTRATATTTAKPPTLHPSTHVNNISVAAMSDVVAGALSEAINIDTARNGRAEYSDAITHPTSKKLGDFDPLLMLFEQASRV